MKYDKLLRKIREYDIDDIADVDAIRNRYETEILVLSGNSSNVNLYFNFSQSEIITLEGNGYIIDGVKNVLFKECNSGINIITFKSTGFAKIKISDAPLLFFKGKISRDMSYPFREKRQMC